MRSAAVACLLCALASAGELSNIENSVAQAARKTRESVVTVLAVKKGWPDVTGVVVARGIVLTIRRPFVEGSHAVEKVKIRFHANGKTVDAEVIAEDVKTNTILLKSKGGKARTIKPRLDDDIHLGMWTLMVGNTFRSGRESDPVVSLGVVSGIDNTPTGLKSFHTSTLVNPGAFGAPVVDLGGGLLGIMDMQITKAGGQSVVIPYERIYNRYQAEKGPGARALGKRPYKSSGGSSLHAIMGLVVEEAARRGAVALVSVRSGEVIDPPKPEKKKAEEKKKGKLAIPPMPDLPGKKKQRPKPPPPVPRLVPGERKGHDRSSGVIVSADGLILCPLRVTGWPGPQRKLFVDTPTGRIRVARMLGYDERVRMALIKIDAKDLPILPVAMADELTAGQFVVALGYPHGNPDGGSPQLTFGVLSRKNALGNIHPAFRALQTDAGIAGGNRGGPLVDIEGRLLGVLVDVNETERRGYQSRKLRARYVGNAGLGFALPMHVVAEILPRLEKGEIIKRALLGVELAPAGDGLRLSKVPEGGAAHAAKLQVGDVIVSVAGTATKTVKTLQRVLGVRYPGDVVEIVYLRNGAKATVKLTLGPLPPKDEEKKEKE